LLLLSCGGLITQDDDDQPPPLVVTEDARPSGPGSVGPSGSRDGSAGPSDASTDQVVDAHVCVACGDASCVDTSVDHNNCGACGSLCAGTCTGGRCLVELAKISSPTGLALDATNLYVTAYDGKVRKVPISGDPVTVLVDGLKAPWGVAVDATTVYYGDANIVGGGNGATLGSVPIAGGSNTVLVSNLVGGRILALGAGHVLWDSGGYQHSTTSIEEVPISGGTPSVVVPKRGGGFHSIRGMATADDTLYFSEDTFGLQSVPLAGGPPNVLSSLGTGDLAIDATHIYFIASGSILEIPRGGGLVTTLASGQTTPSSIAVDASNVYWTNRYGINQSTVQRAPIGGGSIVTLATNQGNTDAIAVDASNVYWLCATALGSVRKMNK